MSLEVFEEWESEVRGYIRAFPTLFDTASGSVLVDQGGRQYIDFFAGAEHSTTDTTTQASSGP